MCTVIHGCSHLGGPDMRVLASKQAETQNAIAVHSYAAPIRTSPRGQRYPARRPPRDQDQAQAERADAGRTVVAGWFPVPA